jgi:hypothetical protein
MELKNVAIIGVCLTAVGGLVYLGVSAKALADGALVVDANVSKFTNGKVYVKVSITNLSRMSVPFDGLNSKILIDGTAVCSVIIGQRYTIEAGKTTDIEVAVTPNWLGLVSVLSGEIITKMKSGNWKALNADFEGTAFSAGISIPIKKKLA